MKLLVVLINYRTPDLTLRALEFVLPELDRVEGECRVALVDNDSGDGSFDRIARAVHDKGFSEHVDLIQTAHNGGFAYGVNAGTRPALASDDPPDYVYLLNSDAFVDPFALSRLVEFLDAHPQAGIAGSQLYGSDGRAVESAFQFHSLLGEFESALGLGIVSHLLARWRVAGPVPAEVTRIDWLAGASMLIRSDVFRQVGLFDEGFFLYYEETDFCLRAARAGWTTWYIPESRVQHLSGMSTGMTDPTRPRATYWFHARRYYFAKNYGRFYLFATNVVCLIGMTLGRIKALLLGRRYPRPPRFFRDFVRFNFVSPPEHPCAPDTREK